MNSAAFVPKKEAAQTGKKRELLALYYCAESILCQCLLKLHLHLAKGGIHHLAEVQDKEELLGVEWVGLVDPVRDCRILCRVWGHQCLDLWHHKEVVGMAHHLV